MNWVGKSQSCFHCNCGSNWNSNHGWILIILKTNLELNKPNLSDSCLISCLPSSQFFVYKVSVHSVVAMWILLLQRLSPIHICLVFFRGDRKEPLQLQYSQIYMYLLAYSWSFFTKLFAQLSFLSNYWFLFCFLRLMHHIWFIFKYYEVYTTNVSFLASLTHDVSSPDCLSEKSLKKRLLWCWWTGRFWKPWSFSTGLQVCVGKQMAARQNRNNILDLCLHDGNENVLAGSKWLIVVRGK